MTSTCPDHVTLDLLIDYHHADLPVGESEELEEHLFTCAPCGRRLQALAHVERGVRRLVRRGRVPLVLTDALKARLAAEGVRTREYRVEPGGSVRCGVDPGDELIVVHLVADLAGAARANLVLADAAGIVDLRHDDIPLEATRCGVSVAYPGQMLRDLPDLVVHARLCAEGEEPRVEHYTLLHAHDGASAGST